MCQIGGCCIYVVFIAANIKSIVDYATDSNTDVRLFMVVILLPIIFLNWVRAMSYLEFENIIQMKNWRKKFDNFGFEIKKKWKWCI